MIVKEIKVHSDFSPSGDQPDAIERIVNGLNDGLLHQVLLFFRILTPQSHLIFQVVRFLFYFLFLHMQPIHIMEG